VWGKTPSVKSNNIPVPISKRRLRAEDEKGEKEGEVFETLGRGGEGKPLPPSLKGGGGGVEDAFPLWDEERMDFSRGECPVIKKDSTSFQGPILYHLQRRRLKEESKAKKKRVHSPERSPFRKKRGEPPLG